MATRPPDGFVAENAGKARAECGQYPPASVARPEDRIPTATAALKSAALAAGGQRSVPGSGGCP